MTVAREGTEDVLRGAEEAADVSLAGVLLPVEWFVPPQAEMISITRTEHNRATVNYLLNGHEYSAVIASSAHRTITR